MRNVVVKLMLSASPRISGPFVEDSSTVKKRSRAVWMEKAEGLSGTGMAWKDSSGEMAVAFALRMPYLLQLRYLCTVSIILLHRWLYEPSVMSLQAKSVCASDAICDENLPHIVRFGCRQVALDNVLDSAREDLAIRITCHTAGWLGGKHNDNGS
jgi:hypothetical protein